MSYNRLTMWLSSLFDLFGENIFKLFVDITPKIHYCIYMKYLSSLFMVAALSGGITWSAPYEPRTQKIVVPKITWKWVK